MFGSEQYKNTRMLLPYFLISVFFVFVCDFRLCQGIELNNSSSASEPEELPTDVELEETRRLIQEGDDFVEMGRDIVLLFGITGAGKSTLGLLLSGDNRYLAAVESERKSGRFYIVDTNNRISRSKLLSQTIFPEKMVDNNGTVYYDCPGFSDTRSLAHDVTASHFIRRVIDNAERVKFILVIGHDFLESRSMFTELILHTASYIHNINAFRDGIALIVTKVKKSYYEDDDGNIHAVPDETEIQEIAKYFIDVKETIQDSKRNLTHISEENQKTYELATQYIDILLQKNGNNYTKIGIFRSPSKAGPLSENKSIQKNKLVLRDLIENDLKFTVKSASDFTNFTVSQRTRSSIEKSVKNLNHRVQKVLKKISDRFDDFYAKQEDDLNDVFIFTNEIRQHVQVWNSFRNNSGDNVTAFSKKLQTTIHQLNVTFCEENLQTLSEQIEYNNMWNLVLPDLELTFLSEAIIWKSILEPFQKRINETIRWYDSFLKFNKLLASYEIQSKRTELVQMYGYRNTNRSNQLHAEWNYTLDYEIVQNQIEELSVGTSNHRKSLLNDIWDNNMQPVSKTLDFETNTLRIHSFILKLSDVRGIINSNEYDAIENYEFFALDTIYIDDDITLTNNKNLVIIAPLWIVKGSHFINLNGKDGENYLELRSEWTKDGLPGRAGQSAGNFLGVAFEIKNSHWLNVSAVGGNGGSGQNGAPGYNGDDGADGNLYMKFRNILPIALSTFDGRHGTPGKAGRNGGAGGYGGYCGNVQLVIESPKMSESRISILNCGAKRRGADGEDGVGGRGGRGGQMGDTVQYACVFLCLDYVVSARTTNYVYASNGANGIDGKNKENMENIKARTPAINKAIALNNYKFILRESLNEPGKHKNIQQIKSQHEKFGNIQEISEFYGFNDFVDELITLETQWQHFGEIYCIDLYESLLHRIENYLVGPDSTLFYLTTVILTRIHYFRGGFGNYLETDTNKYINLIAENINNPIKQFHLTLDTTALLYSVNEANRFITSLINDVSPRLEEMQVYINSTESELMELEQQITVKAWEVKRKLNELVSKQDTLEIFKVIISIGSAILDGISLDQFVPRQEVVPKEIESAKTEINTNSQILHRTIENQHKFDSKITSLLAELEMEIRSNNNSKTQIGLDLSRYKLTRLLMEFDHLLKQISVESVEEVRLFVKKLEYAIQMMLNINDRAHAYNQQSQLSVYLNEIEGDSMRTNSHILTQLKNVIRTNLICTKYKEAINAVTLFVFPFADAYFADQRNLCNVNTFNVSSVDMLATRAYTQIKELSNRLISFNQTVNAQLDNNIHIASFNNKSGIGPFYRWSNADNRNSIHNLLAGNEVVLISEITNTVNTRMAVKFKEIGIALRTHETRMQSDFDTVLDKFGVTMKHMGFSHYRWHEEFYVITSDTNVVIKKSFRECYNSTNSCDANDAYYKLRDGNAFLSPYTMWTLKLHSETTRISDFDNLQRFADHVDIELEGTGTYVDTDIHLDNDLMSVYYREYLQPQPRYNNIKLKW